MGTIARAHPNIALIKYWGKQSQAGGPSLRNLPATASLSITLDTLCSITEVETADSDKVLLNSKLVEDAKISASLKMLRESYDVPPLQITSTNNFPTAAGLASSASGFAALITAIDHHCALGMSADERSEYSRRASGSAARSIYGGFVGLQGPDWIAQPLLDADQWPLKVVIAITDEQPKSVSSSSGMLTSAQTSPYYSAWVATSDSDYNAAIEVLDKRDFAALAELSESSCLKMHAVMQTSQPPMLYWRPATIACIEAVWKMREAGREVFFTIDAGPQLKAVCTASEAEAVHAELARIPGVISTRIAGLGGGAEVLTP